MPMDIEKARWVILDELAKDSRVLADPAPTVWAMKLADSSVNLGVKPWVKTQDY